MSKHKKDSLTQKAIIENNSTLEKAEKSLRFKDSEFFPFAKNTNLVEVANGIIIDKDGPWRNKIHVFKSKHATTVGIQELIRQGNEFLEEKGKEYDIQPLSITAGIEGNKIALIMFVRVYSKTIFRVKEIYEFIGETIEYNDNKDSKNKLLIPENAYKKIKPEEHEIHQKLLLEQNKVLKKSSKEEPFLNSIKTYIPKEIHDINPQAELGYDLRTRDMAIQLNMSYKDFIQIFHECMRFITTNKKDNFYSVLRGKDEKKNFYSVIEAHIKRRYIETSKLPHEDLPALMAKIDRALFDLYIVQDLIDDPLITDIKITDPYSIRVRVHGKAYLSNITFIDAEDYMRFIQGLAVLNNIDLSIPTQTFTDEQDDNYILRFSLTAPYITSTGYPIIHIRKIPRHKPMSNDLIKAGMFDEKIRDYLIDCGKHSTGIVFAGPPGSGKTTALNWFLEDGYENSAEILVIQENDELFTYRKGVMFQHVVMNPQRGEKACSLEDLGKMALVAGANVFVIGEAKGAEITSAITLSNSGCRTAITIHSQSSLDTIDKMTDLAMRGSSNITYEQAKRMIKSFQTIVYMEDYKVKEISEIIGYDEEKKDMIYRMIYKRK